MKKIAILALCVFTFSFTQAQKIHVLDTIRVASLQKFNAPSVGALVLSNILRLNYTAELLDDGMKKIRNVQSATQKPKKEDLPKAAAGGRGTTVWLVFNDYIEKPGNYYIKVSIDASGELGSLKQDVYYYIVVSNPNLAAPVTLRASYYPGEKEAFSFATVEYQDLNLYSYEIMETGGTILQKGNGPIVKLDSILKNSANVGKKIKVRGLYQGNEFSYKNSVTGNLETSVWDFSIEKPSLEEFSQWEKKENDQWLVSVYNSQAKSFWFVYIGSTPSGFAVSTPDLSGLRVTSDPENFVSGASQRRSASFRVVDLNINQEFLDAMKVGDEQKVKVTISFRTQFGEQVKRDYYAVVIK